MNVSLSWSPSHSIPQGPGKPALWGAPHRGLCPAVRMLALAEVHGEHPNILKSAIYALAAALLSASAFAGPPAKSIVYNNLEGDGGVDLDRSIKQAYSSTYTVVDTSKAAGYVEPRALAGDLPKYVKDGQGKMISGYVLVAYIVTSDGAVDNPVIIKWSDERLCQVAVQAMAGWRFMPGTLKGLAVATTAAQEFSFGPSDESNGFKMERVVIYQSNDITLRRLPPGERTKSYFQELELVAHNFFVGDAVPETLSIVVVTRPGRRSRVWFVSSIRPGTSKELEPLRKLLEGVPPLDVREGPVTLALTGLIAGGDGKDTPMGEDYRNPMPSEWQEAARALKDPLPVSSDAFIDRVWPDSP
jgi:hypothetical protein